MEGIINWGNSIIYLAKFGVIIFLGIYIIFSIAVSKQVKIMTDTLEVGFETPIRILALAHLIMSVMVFIIAIVIL